MREREEYIKDIWVEIILRSAKMLDADFTMPHDIARERAFAEVIGRVLDKREALAAACVQGTPMGEAHTTRVRVLDEWRVLDNRGDECAVKWNAQEAEQERAWYDETAPEDAPHRVVRVALVDANHPEMPEGSTRVTDEMVERAAKALYLRGDLSHWGTWEQEIARYKETYYEDALAVITAALEGSRDQ
jgi:hypothetical protein